MSRNIIASGIVLGVSLSVSAAQTALACACGCGIFDVGTASMFPTDQGGMAYVSYDYMNQNQDWVHDGKADAAANPDKRVLTSFITPGVQYMFSRAWGVNVEVPVWNRSFVTQDDGGIEHLNHTAFGDIRIKGIYTGLSADMSTGLTFGIKLPNGDSSYFRDADTEIGTGSTDLLPGFFQRGSITSGLDWFVNGQADVPVQSKRQYHPGAEADVSAGVHTNGWDLGRAGLLTPEFQLVGTWRAADSGEWGDHANSGYRRLYAAPGIEWDVNRIMVNANVELPLVVNTTGYQLVANPLFKVTVGYMF